MVAWLFVSGCHHSTPPGAMVLSQTPLTATAAPTQDALDLRYPPGSRVVFAVPPFRTGDVRLLSKGLLAAGEPIVAPDGRRVFFSGKAEAHSSWQIYQAGENGRPEAVTAMPGGAMNPAIIANGDLVFSSPVPKAGETWKTDRPAALHAKPISGLPRRLTFGTAAAVEATVLDDGRILFVSARPMTNRSAPPELGLFTINNDGTEFTAFALDRDGAPQVRRPRALPGGRVAFVAAADDRAGEARAEVVRTARPFASRAALFSFSVGGCESIEPERDGTLLACLETRGLLGRRMRGAFAVFRLGPDAAVPGAPVFFDPAWNNLDATPVVARPRPMGHVSAMKPAAKFGTILCLDANFTRWGQADARSAKAEKVRVIGEVKAGQTRVLGEVGLQADGSFMAEVPPEISLGFEALDAQGAVVRRLPPAVWVRPGENRSCIGCHQPYNRSPRNIRPLAASQPATRLEIPAAATRQASR